jgi:hypothetical protein
MTEVSARVSLAIAVHERTLGLFPAMQVYPVSLERYLTPGRGPLQVTKVHGQADTLPADGSPVEVNLLALGFGRVKLICLENLSPYDECAEQIVTLEDAPIGGSVGQQQVLMASDDLRGWAPDVYRLTGTPGTGFRLLVLGD